MSAFPVILDGSKVSAVVIGGGAVAARKIRVLLDAGATVSAVATRFNADVEALATTHSSLTLVREAYAANHIGEAMLVVAATDDAAVNGAVASDAMRARRLVNIVDAPGDGNFVTPAVHRSGDLTIAVSAGRVPGAAAAIRRAIAERFDGRYALAVAELRELRDQMIGRGDRDKWKAASADLFDEKFCDAVESKTLRERVAAWR